MAAFMKPLLAAAFPDGKTIQDLSYPQIASPKLDGVRCLITPQGAFSRKGELLPNQHLQALVRQAGEALHGMDGELIVGDPTDPDIFNKTTGAVRRRDGTPDVKFYVFDNYGMQAVYVDRIRALQIQKSEGCLKEFDFVKILDWKECVNSTELSSYEDRLVEMGYEGAMTRIPHGKYKLGRSTFKEGILLKIKRFEDDEAEIIGFEPRYKNNNEATTDVQGHTKRSSHKSNMEAQETLGALVLIHPKFGMFNVGSGFDDETRKYIWEHKNEYLSELAKFKYQPCGVVDKPRFPIYIGKRMRMDT